MGLPSSTNRCRNAKVITEQFQQHNKGVILWSISRRTPCSTPSLFERVIPRGLEPEGWGVTRQHQDSPQVHPLSNAPVGGKYALKGSRGSFSCKGRFVPKKRSSWSPWRAWRRSSSARRGLSYPPGPTPPRHVRGLRGVAEIWESDLQEFGPEDVTLE